MADKTRTGWTTVAFGDVVKLSKARSKDLQADGIDRYVGLEHLEPRDLKIRSWGDVADGTTFTSVFRPGQVLFGKRRAYQRKLAVADFTGVCSGDIYVFEPSGELLLPEFLPYLCQSESFFEYAVKTSAGSLSPRTNWTHLAKYEFCLPPLDEQRHILRTLHGSATYVSNLSRLTESLSVLHAAAAASYFEDLRGTCPFVPLVDVCSREPQSGIYKPPESWGSGTPVVTMTELFAHDVIRDAVQCERVEVERAESNRFEITPDDILFGRRSLVLAGAGRCIRVESLAERTIFESSVLRVTVDKEKVDSRYVFEWFRSPVGHQLIRRMVTFTTVSGVAGSDVARLSVPLPPLAVQTEIAERLCGLRQRLDVPQYRLAQARLLSTRLVNHLVGQQ